MEHSIPYLLTISSNTPGIERFIGGLYNLEVEHIAIQFYPYTYNLKSHKQYSERYPGHIKKYDFVPRDLDPTRHIIFTDTDDVVFQKSLPQFTKDMHLAPENITHRDTIYKDLIAHTPELGYLMDKPVFNSGCFAMKVPVFYLFIDFLKEMSEKIPTSLNQVFFNHFVYSHGFSIEADPTVFCPIFANIHQIGKLKKLGGKWYYEDQLVSCVHGNGWTKEII